MQSPATRARVLIGTTEGPVLIMRLTEEHPALRRSVVCIGGTTETALIDSAYDAFVKRPTGIIEELYDHPCYRLDISAPIDTGSSWQLGVLLAHMLFAADRLAGQGDDAGLLILATGAIGIVERDVRPVTHIARKIDNAFADLAAHAAQGKQVIVAVPRANLSDVTGEIQARLQAAGIELLAVGQVNDLVARLGLRRNSLQISKPTSARRPAASGISHRTVAKLPIRGMLALLLLVPIVMTVTAFKLADWAKREQSTRLADTSRNSPPIATTPIQTVPLPVIPASSKRFQPPAEPAVTDVKLQKTGAADSEIGHDTTKTEHPPQGLARVKRFELNAASLQAGQPVRNLQQPSGTLADPAAQPQAQQPGYPALSTSAATFQNGKHRAELVPGVSFRDCPQCPEMIVIPAGAFVMGSPSDQPGHEVDEGPQREIRFARPMAVGRGSISLEQYDAFVRDSRHIATEGCTVFAAGNWRLDSNRDYRRSGLHQGSDHPAICVSWHDAKAYAAWLSSKTGKLYRLPTEAEREYFTRAGTRTAFWFGDAIGASQANYDATTTFNGGSPGQYRRTTLRIFDLAANPWGLSHVHGNVAEWVEDCWSPDHRGAAADGSTRTSGDCTMRVLRGGSWGYPAKDLRSAYREAIAAEQRYFHVGFRIVTENIEARP